MASFDSTYGAYGGRARRRCCSYLRLPLMASRPGPATLALVGTTFSTGTRERCPPEQRCSVHLPKRRWDSRWTFSISRDAAECLSPRIRSVILWDSIATQTEKIFLLEAINS